MEGRKLLDAHIFNGRQEIAKPIVTNIVVPWIFEIFISILCILGVKNIYCLKRSCCKKDSQFYSIIE